MLDEAPFPELLLEELPPPQFELPSFGNEQELLDPFELDPELDPDPLPEPDPELDPLEALSFDDPLPEPEPEPDPEEDELGQLGPLVNDGTLAELLPEEEFELLPDPDPEFDPDPLEAPSLEQELPEPEFDPEPDPEPEFEPELDPEPEFEQVLFEPDPLPEPDPELELEPLFEQIISTTVTVQSSVTEHPFTSVAVNE